MIMHKNTVEAYLLPHFVPIVVFHTWAKYLQGPGGSSVFGIGDPEL
jgi:hypothetical protein